MSSDVKPVSFYAYNEAMRERNEARAEVERLKYDIGNATEEKDVALREVERLTRERDEWETRADNCAKEIEHLRVEVERMRARLREWLHERPSDGTSTRTLSVRTRAALGEG